METVDIRDFLVLDDGSMLRKDLITRIYIIKPAGHQVHHRIIIDGHSSNVLYFNTLRYAKRSLARLTAQLQPEKKEI